MIINPYCSPGTTVLIRRSGYQRYRGGVVMMRSDIERFYLFAFAKLFNSVYIYSIIIYPHPVDLHAYISENTISIIVIGIAHNDIIIFCKTGCRQAGTGPSGCPG